MMVGMAGVAIGIHRTTGSRSLAWGFAKARARDLATLLGVEVTMHGIEHVEKAGPVIYAPNHQSHLDILTLLGHLPGATRFAAKRELWRHPIVGGVLDTLGMIPIDRDAGERSIEVLNGAAKDSSSIVIFPEARAAATAACGSSRRARSCSRSPPGCPIVPVCCVGTRRLMPRGSQLTVVPGKVEIFVEPPIQTTDLTYEDRDALAARVREAILKNHKGY
jgi:1-acyl-sn-glycerol-3-phosphate acyltransferase